MSNVHLFYQNQALPLGRDTNINCFSNTNFLKKDGLESFFQLNDITRTK